MFFLEEKNDRSDPGRYDRLFQAVQNYEPDQNSSFSASQNCVFRQLYSAIEASRRKTTQSLNSYVSLYDMTEEKEPLINTMEAHKTAIRKNY